MLGFGLRTVRIRRVGAASVAASHGLKENENSTLIRDSALVDGLRLLGAEGNLEGFDVVQQQFSLVFTADGGAAMVPAAASSIKSLRSPENYFSSCSFSSSSGLKARCDALSTLHALVVVSPFCSSHRFSVVWRASMSLFGLLLVYPIAVNASHFVCSPLQLSAFA